MKTCARCGYNDWKPKDKCPECGDKYKSQKSQCNPLSGHIDEIGRHNTFSTEGNYHFESKKKVE